MINLIKKFKSTLIGIAIGMFLASSIAYAAPISTIKVVLSSFKMFQDNQSKGNISAFKYNNDYYVPMSKIITYLKDTATFNGTEMRVTSVAKPLNAKIIIDGNEKSPTYIENNKDYPNLIMYKNIVYTPINYIVQSFEKPIKYKSSDRTFYIGKNTDGIYMSDIIEPYNATECYYYNNKEMTDDNLKCITMASKQYDKGYMISYSSSKKATVDFNLEGKYSSISGLLGLDDNGYLSEDDVLDINIVGDGTTIKTFKLKRGDLPIDININVNGVIRLTVELSRQHYTTHVTRVDLANLKIE